MFKPYNRYLMILFMAGFMWGYVAKSFVITKIYVGYKDPQILEQKKFDIINLDDLKTTPVDLSKENTK